ncbi:hypothetical protein HNQ56_001560 [Anaerotaenia torta]|uniref:hypothetical protein n=1 Tax=Anaerotaenia torta TaxID=433293 RepID=UPI003D21EF71
MLQTIQETARMMEMLTESEQESARQFVARLVQARHPQFSRLAPEERERLEAMEKEPGVQ